MPRVRRSKSSTEQLLESMVHAAWRDDEALFRECLALHTRRLIEAGFARDDVKALAQVICEQLNMREPWLDPN